MLFRHVGLAAAPLESAAHSGFVLERPPPGLARGKYPASPFSIAALGAALLLGTLVYFFLSLRKTRT